MRLEESTFEEDFNDVLTQIEVTSNYGRLRSREKKYMTAAEMGELLALKKTDRYWLLHHHHFEWEEVLGLYRINIASFEKWYANQVKYKNVNGEAPGKELKEWTFSPQEIAELLGTSDWIIYELIKEKKLDVVTIRKVFLPRTVAYQLIDWKKEQDKLRDVLGNEYIDYNLVMATTYGLPIGNGAIRKSFNKLIKEHNLPPVVFHSLRHTSVTYKLKLNGGDIKAVQGDSGHSQINMVTDVYSHIIDDDRRRNAEMFEDAFYGKKDLDPQLRKNEEGENIMTVPEGVDPELLAKVLANPEMAAPFKFYCKKHEIGNTKVTHAFRGQKPWMHYNIRRFSSTEYGFIIFTAFKYGDG